MGERIEIRIPDLGGAEKVEVVEVLVAPGQRIAAEEGLATMESDKASMDIPSPRAGIVREVKLKVGDRVGEGDVVVVLEVVPATQDEVVPATQDEGVAATAGGDEAAPDAGEPASAAGSRKSPVASTARAATGATDGDGDLHAEVLVLGAGPGGYTAAFRAADLGKRVVLVERYPKLGGVCLNVGCIPSKALLHVARVIEEAADLEGHGVRFGRPEIDLAALRAFKQSVVDRLTGGLARLAKQRRVTVVEGTGAFQSPYELAVEGAGGARTITFDHAIVAAGSRPIRLPDLPLDDPRVMDSTAALELADVPGRLLLVGGGVVGLEMAMVYGSLGSRLTIVELLDGLVPGCDRDLVRPLERRLTRRMGAQIHLQSRVTRVKSRDDGLEAFFEGSAVPASALFDRILVAVSRRPNGDLIGAAAAGLELTDRGFLTVDRQQRTRVPHIFAIGDITGPPLLAHKASHQGKVAAEVMAGLPSSFDARVIPAVAYTDPEIAWVGLTETAAEAGGIPYEKGAFPWAASGRALGMGRDDGLTKILFEPGTRRILGAGVVGPNAGDLISELALAIEMGCDAGDVALTVHPHPTLSETVAFAAEAAEGTLTDLFLGRGRS